MREKFTEVSTVLGISIGAISLNWTQINQVLNAILTLITILYVARKIRWKKKP